ncbi:unnamed protein product, partial [Staurois parvus]
MIAYCPGGPMSCQSAPEVKVKENPKFWVVPRKTLEWKLVPLTLVRTKDFLNLEVILNVLVLKG